jgi:hypothetical protein
MLAPSTAPLWRVAVGWFFGHFGILAWRELGGIILCLLGVSSGSEFWFRAVLTRRFGEPKSGSSRCWR